ncbi:prepilin-type N-terminal cleavage/methylation domain-containing protein [Sutcliffiella horikoshii]|uniref:Prepilin-type N-terminal cleavage/methylation domain-containing protein n=1 Tax=Sutcliffiella horikoshii TaxID=79883 RepID=A0A5D4SZR2_9BACI|nr:prepilin-type N-terminal cleavage/methylation domain-containing protein [Sutcliffiella horikoshii]TYS68930.1 prepilin-type N-terminal cleavage/methylation domain-containing protein [Sutcliffiella horikoshii]
MLKFTREKINNDSGFTLLEVLVSIVILSIIILTFLSFFSQALLFSVKEEDNLVGVNISERILYYVEGSSTIESVLSANTYSCDAEPHSLVSYIADQDPQDEWQTYPPDLTKLFFTQNNRTYYSYVTICQSAEETDLSLHRVHIKTYQSMNNASQDRFIYETYQYVNLFE